MKTLLILRHAKSSWRRSHLADHDRPLSRRGKEDAPKMGRMLAREGLVPDLIISSTARRALETAEAVAAACDCPRPVVATRSLYLAGPEAYLELLRPLGPEVDRVMLVGHNPGMEELLLTLTGRYERLPTAALAWIELPVNAWAEVDEATEGRLAELWWPKELRP